MGKRFLLLSVSTIFLISLVVTFSLAGCSSSELSKSEALEIVKKNIETPSYKLGTYINVRDRNAKFFDTLKKAEAAGYLTLTKNTRKSWYRNRYDIKPTEKLKDSILKTRMHLGNVAGWMIKLGNNEVKKINGITFDEVLGVKRAYIKYDRKTVLSEFGKIMAKGKDFKLESEITITLIKDKNGWRLPDPITGI